MCSLEGQPMAHTHRHTCVRTSVPEQTRQADVRLQTSSYKQDGRPHAGRGPWCVLLLRICADVASLKQQSILSLNTTQDSQPIARASLHSVYSNQFTPAYRVHLFTSGSASPHALRPLLGCVKDATVWVSPLEQRAARDMTYTGARSTADGNVAARGAKGGRRRRRTTTRYIQAAYPRHAVTKIKLTFRGRNAEGEED